MKKLLSLLLVFSLSAAFAFSLVACGNKSGDNGGSKTPSATISEEGNTYVQTKFVMHWASEEAKNDFLTDNKTTEEEVKTAYGDARLKLEFASGRATFTSVPYSKAGLFYDIAEDGHISFYETEEDKTAGKKFVEGGVLMNDFVMSADYKTIRMRMNIEDGSSYFDFTLTIQK